MFKNQIVNFSLQTRHLARHKVRQVLRKAFKMWSDIADIRFRETKTDEPDIWIRFFSPKDRESYPFDGPSGYLAHAFYPNAEGQNEEKVGRNKGITLSDPYMG